MSKPNKPTHELKVKDIETGDYGKVVVAWLDQETGWYTIKLQPGTSLTYESMKDKYLTLFPIRTDQEWAMNQAKRHKKTLAKTDEPPVPPKP